MKHLIAIALIICGMQTAISQNLGLNLQVGETYYQNSKSDISIKQEIQGQALDINMTVSGKLEFLVKEEQDDLYLMDTKYHSIAMKTSSPYGTMEFSSDNADDPDDLMSNILSRILSHTFEVKMKKDGSIEEINNLEEMFTNLFDDQPDIPDMQKAQIINQLKQSYGESSFRGNIEVVTAIFPDKDVKVNDTWTNQIAIQSSIQVLMDSEYTLKELEDDYALIAVTASSETSDSGEFEEVNGMPTKFNLAGNLTGTIRVNKITGWIENSDIHQEFKGNVEIGDNPQIPGGMIIPMEMVSNTNISN